MHRFLIALLLAATTTASWISPGAARTALPHRHASPPLRHAAPLLAAEPPANAESEDFDLLRSVLQGIEPSADVAAILVVYFVQGALGLARLSTTFYLKDDLHLSAAEVAALGGVITLPWLVKPLYGFVTDSYPFLGYRRRSYLAAAGAVGCASYLALSAGLPTAPQTVGALVLGSAAVAVSDVVADSMVVERARAIGLGTAVAHDDDDDDAADAAPALTEASDAALPELTLTTDAQAREENKASGTLQSLCWSSRAVGSLSSAYFSGAALQALGAKTVFGISSILPLLVTAAAVFVDEPRLEEAPDEADADEASSQLEVAKAQVALLWSALSRREIWQPALFVGFFLATPSADSAFLYFLTDDLGFSQEFLGRVSLGGSVASIAGITIYQRYLRSVRVSTLLLWTTLACLPFGLLQLALVTHANRQFGLPDSWFAFGDDVVLSVLGEFAHMPTLVLAARLCPAGVEGTLFATLMSLYNAAGTLGSEVGAALTAALGVGTDGNFENLALLVVLCQLSSLLPLPFLGVLDGIDAPDDVEIEQDGGG